MKAGKAQAVAIRILDEIDDLLTGKSLQALATGCGGQGTERFAPGTEHSLLREAIAEILVNETRPRKRRR
jgi:hypothetical protein